MNTTIILAFLVIQFIIQLIAYNQIKKLIFKINILLFKFIKQDKYKSILTTEMVVLNLLISMLVLTFTAAGAIAGMTNLFASVLLGLYMTYDVNKFIKQYMEKNNEKINC